MIDKFVGPYAFLSNVRQPCEIVHIEPYAPFEKIIFTSCEHYYQAMKHTDIDYRRKMTSMSNGFEAKKFGRTAKIREDWEDIKINVMRLGIWLKFRDMGLRKQLIATYPHKIVEGNTWGDTFWGVYKSQGQNMLGTLLMELREKLMKDINMGLTVRTAHYRYGGKYRLDITFKGKDPVGSIFAPSWQIVNGYLKKQITKEEYEKIYHEMMLHSYRKHQQVWNYILSMETITFVCFCKAGDFCHRVLLAQYFQQLGANYIGERNLKC